MNTINDFHVLMECGYNDSAIIQSIPEGSLDKRDFNRGHVLSNTIEDKLTLHFSDEYPENIKLYDFVENTLNLLIVSERTKTVFDNEEVKDLDYIPVQLVDHKGNIAGKDYYIVNFLKRQPIIDMDNSEYDLSYVSNLILDIDLLCLNITEVDSDAKLFRSTTEATMNFIRDDLLQALQRAELKGIKTVLAEGWDGNTFSF